MRKDTKIIIMEVFNDIVGGLCNAYYDGILETEDIYDEINTIETLVDEIYTEAINLKNEIKFDGTISIKKYITKLINNDDDIIDVLEFLKNKKK